MHIPHISPQPSNTGLYVRSSSADAGRRLSKGLGRRAHRTSPPLSEGVRGLAPGRARPGLHLTWSAADATAAAAAAATAAAAAAEEPTEAGEQLLAASARAHVQRVLVRVRVRVRARVRVRVRVWGRLTSSRS
eukprot:scaffold130061_cov65-Phaeocystis_antarctica.AAC.3